MTAPPRRDLLVREVVHASRAAGKDDHLSALAGTTDVQGRSVRRGNSQLIDVHNPAGKVVDCDSTSACANICAQPGERRLTSSAPISGEPVMHWMQVRRFALTSSVTDGAADACRVGAEWAQRGWRNHVRACGRLYDALDAVALAALGDE